MCGREITCDDITCESPPPGTRLPLAKARVGGLVRSVIKETEIVKTIHYMTHRPVCILCILVAATVVQGSSLASAQASRDVAPDELLVLLQGLEEATTVLEYDVHYCTRRTSPDSTVNFTEPLGKWKNTGEPIGVDKTAHFLLEYSTGRINFTREGTGRAVIPDTGERLLSKSKGSLAFDGMTRTQMAWNQDQKRGPGSGVISDQPLVPNKELSSFESGMDVFLPFYRGVGLKRYLSSDKVDQSSIRAILRSDGVLEVSYAGREKGDRFGLWVDLQKDGAILQETYYTSAQPPSVVVRTENLWEKDAEGNWIPHSCLGVAGSVHPTIHEFTFTAVRRNHVDPQPEMFRIKFPPGTDISDFRTGTTYQVGVSPAQLVEDVTNTLVETRWLISNSGAVDGNVPTSRHALSRDANDAAPRANLASREQGANGDSLARADVANAGNQWVLWVTIGIVAIIGAFLSGWVLHMRKGRKIIGGSVMIFLVATVVQPRFSAQAETSKVPFHSWNAPGPGDEQIPVYQCGLAGAVYTLKYFDRFCRPDDLMDLMVPSAQGISLADLMRALQVHGLETSPKSGVRAEDLLASLTDQRIAILPTKVAGQKGHLYVIVRGKGSSFLLVDAGRSVKTEALAEIQARLDKNQGVAVFVWPRQQGGDARIVTIDPQEADLGKFYSDGHRVTSKFIIRNDSTKHVFVTDVVPSCSCTALGWKKGLLSPGQEVTVEMSIRPGSADMGRFKKSISFRFADGSVRQAYMVGECLGPNQSQGIQVSPTEMYFDLGQTPSCQTRHFQVVGKGPIHVGVQEADWIEAKVTQQPGKEPGAIEVVVDPNRTPENQATGVLQVWVNDQEPRVTIPIHTVRPKPYKVESRIVTLIRDKGPKSGTFVFRRVAQNVSRIEVGPITGDLSGIQLQPVQSEQDSGLQVSIAGDGSLASGLHPIEVQVRVDDAAGRSYNERVYVVVK